MPTSTEILAVALPLLVGFALLALASLVLRKGGSHLHTRLFGSLFLLSGIKSLGDGLTASFLKADGAAGYVANELHASSPLFPDALSWFRVTQLCALAMLPLLFLFCAAFPHPTRWLQKRPFLGVLAFLPSALLAALLFSAPESTLFGQAALGFNVIATGMTVTAFVLLVRTRARSPDHIERQQAGYVALGFLPSFAATWAITILLLAASGGLVDGAQTFRLLDLILRFLSPMFELLAAGLVAFAILKYNILGIDPKFRVGVKSATVGFVFVLVFLVTQAIENIVLQGQLFAFAGEYGSFLLSGVTSVVLFKPIEKFSGKVSDRLLPRARAGAGAGDRAAEIYHAQCNYVLRDGNVSDRELAFLHNLRAQLGLSETEARAIEEKVERLLKVDSPQTGAQGPPRAAAPKANPVAKPAVSKPAAAPQAPKPAAKAPSKPAPAAKGKSRNG